ncbi:MAG: DUF1553 domain-containing protein [Planctomycetaceae bacterium]
MPHLIYSRFTCRTLSVILIAVLSGSLNAQVPDRISFNEHVRPILSNHCWSCHGRDDHGRQGQLRLDRRDAALLAGESGKLAIVPGRPSASHLVERILTHEADQMMPPESAKRPLTELQKQILQKWIEEGAEFSEHWAFVPPVRPEVPAVKNTEWAASPVDRFILNKLEAEKMQPSRQTAPMVWLRRVTLDLTGLPPTLDEQSEFQTLLKSHTLADAKAKTVDRLLGSSAYAEKMAMHWLDVARYADTNGYNNDEVRTMWPWRDWVIRAFAEGMPYDQFITEQLAGDLLPNATLSQKVATGFNRNHVLTTEGGIIEEEYHVEYVADRIHTTSTVFLALSLQCARCHDHKYDPFSQRDYYQMAAFFNNVPDRIVSYSQGRMAEPLLKVPTAEQQAELDRLASRQTELEKAIAERRVIATAEIAQWEAGLTKEDLEKSGVPGLAHHFTLDETDGSASERVDATAAGKVQGPVMSVAGRIGQALKLDGQNYVESENAGRFESDQAFSSSAWIQLTTAEAATVLSRMDEGNAHRGYDVIMEGGKVAAHFVHHWPDKAFKVITEQPVSQNDWHHVAVTYDGSRKADGVRIYVDGQLQKLTITTNNTLDGTLITEKPFHIGRRNSSAPFRGTIDDVQLFRSALTEEEVRRLATGESAGSLKALVSVPAAERSETQTQQIADYYFNFVDAKTRDLRKELAEIPKKRSEIEASIPVTMVMQEQPDRRPSYILRRGQYDQRGDQVPASIPAVFRDLSNGPSEAAANAQQPTRLDFAHWLTSPKHPLTARVAVNRWWEMLFGTGIVETSEDFGVQGALPTHPELLDWLACELMESGWDTRKILKEIVLSATYGQSSHISPEQLELDPRNRLLGRGARYRLSAETVRDSALAISGLLKQKVGGPSVKPYQPDGLWEDVSVERRDKYVPDEGDGLYRRSMYTFWKRTCPPPTMATFDAPDRETCVVRRARTNTPLQALILMNDPTYIEASRKLAEHVLLSEKDDSARWTQAFRIVLAREPVADEIAAINSVRSAAKEHFQKTPEAATELLKVGRAPADATIPAEELASWSAAMSVLMNLDEAISRE